MSTQRESVGQCSSLRMSVPPGGMHDAVVDLLIASTSSSGSRLRARQILQPPQSSWPTNTAHRLPRSGERDADRRRCGGRRQANTHHQDRLLNMTLVLLVEGTPRANMKAGNPVGRRPHCLGLGISASSAAARFFASPRRCGGRRCGPTSPPADGRIWCGRCRRPASNERISTIIRRPRLRASGRRPVPARPARPGVVPSNCPRRPEIGAGCARSSRRARRPSPLRIGLDSTGSHLGIASVMAMRDAILNDISELSTAFTGRRTASPRIDHRLAERAFLE